jgi:hypothetical protein
MNLSWALFCGGDLSLVATFSSPFSSAIDTQSGKNKEGRGQKGLARSLPKK